VNEGSNDTANALYDVDLNLLTRLQIQRQRVKHLQYEHHGAEAALQAEALATTHRQAPFLREASPAAGCCGYESTAMAWRQHISRVFEIGHARQCRAHMRIRFVSKLER